MLSFCVLFKDVRHRENVAKAVRKAVAAWHAKEIKRSTHAYSALAIPRSYSFGQFAAKTTPESDPPTAGEGTKEVGLLDSGPPVPVVTSEHIRSPKAPTVTSFPIVNHPPLRGFVPG